MPLPPIESVTVATKATPHYLNRIAAAQAGGPPVDFTQGLVRIGDGNGDIPPISALVTAGDVLNEVATGAWVVAVTVNEQDPAQVDVLVVVPAVSGGVELGPFWVTEYAITDENGVVCLVGNTAMAKLVSTQGASSDLAFIASEKLSNGAVTLTPPSAAFASEEWVRNMWALKSPTAEEPIYIDKSTDQGGWQRWLFRIRRATSTVLGVGRPATEAEWAAGAPASGSGVYQFPWPTLQQVKAALAALVYSSGTGVRVAPERTIHLNYQPLQTRAPALSDVLAFLRPAAGQTAESYAKATVQALADAIAPQFNSSVRVKAWAYVRNNALFAAQNITAVSYSGGQYTFTLANGAVSTSSYLISSQYVNETGDPFGGWVTPYQVNARTTSSFKTFAWGLSLGLPVPTALDQFVFILE